MIQFHPNQSIKIWMSVLCCEQWAPPLIFLIGFAWLSLYNIFKCSMTERKDRKRQRKHCGWSDITDMTERSYKVYSDQH